MQIKEGEIDVRQGESGTADVIFQTDMPTYLGLLQRQIEPDNAVCSGLVQVEGDRAALNRFLDLCGLPSRQ